MCVTVCVCVSPLSHKCIVCLVGINIMYHVFLLFLLTTSSNRSSFFTWGFLFLFLFLCFFLLPIHIHLQLSQISTIQFLNMYVGIQFNYSICLAFNSIGDIWALFRFEYVCFDPLTSKHYSTNWLFRTHVWIILKDVIKHCCLGS